MNAKFTDVASAKKFLCCGTTRLYELINAGEIRRVKDGARSLILVDSLEHYADKLMARAA